MLEFDNVPDEGKVKQPTYIVEEHDEEEVFNLTQSVRKAVVKNLTKSYLPTDPEEVQALLTALNDMDKQIYSRAKMKREDKAADNADELKALLAAVITSDASRDRLLETRSDQDEIIEHVPEDLTEIPAEISGSIEFVPGQLDVNPAELSYEKIMDEGPSV